MKSTRIPMVAIVVVSLAVSGLAVVGSRAVSAQDAAQTKYNVRMPNGLAFSEFRGYEGWQTVFISQAETFTTATVPASLHDVDFMVRDGKRFADSGGWGEAVNVLRW